MKDDAQTSEDSRDSGLLSNPLSLLRSGYLIWSDANLVDHGGSGLYWSLRSYSTTYSNGLSFYNTALYPQNNVNRGYGFAVRCVKT